MYSSENILVCLASDVHECPVEWEMFQGSCYFFEVDHDRSWSSAQSSCMDLGAHLVAIDNEDEYTFLQSKVREAVIEVSGYFGREIWWTGGRREVGNEENWFWEENLNVAQGKICSDGRDPSLAGDT